MVHASLKAIGPVEEERRRSLPRYAPRLGATGTVMDKRRGTDHPTRDSEWRLCWNDKPAVPGRRSIPPTAGTYRGGSAC